MLAAFDRGSLRRCAFTGGGCALYTAVCERGFAALTILVSWQDERNS